MKNRRRWIRTAHQAHYLVWVLAISFPLNALADADPKSTTTSFAKELFTWGQGLAVIFGAWRFVVAGMAFGDEEQAHVAPKKLKRACIGMIVICAAVGIVQLIKGKFGMQTI